MSETLSPALIDELRRLDSCAVANAIETFDVRLRNEGFTDARIRCVFPEMPPVIGYAVTATIRCSTPPPVGHTYSDRTDWWNDILKTPAPRVVVVQDVDTTPGLGAFVGEVHSNILERSNRGTRDQRRGPRSAGCSRIGPSAVRRRHQPVARLRAHPELRRAGDHRRSGDAPGDLLFGDRHGVVSIPPAVAAAVPATAAEMRQKERKTIEYCRGSDFSTERLRSIVNDWD